MPVVVTDKLRQLGDMKTERSSYDSHYRDLGDYFLPRRLRWIESAAQARGSKMNQKLIDPGPRFAARTLASGMHAGSTNPSMPWFKMVTPDPEMMEFPMVSQWLYTVEQILRDIFERSNLYAVLPMIYQDAGVFGTAPLDVLEHPDRVIHCVPAAVGSYYLSTDYYGNVDTKYREYKMTVAQMVSEFGLEKCSTPVQDAYKNKRLKDMHDVLHIIEPNTGRRDSYASADMPWRSCYIEMRVNEQSKVLREKGFEDNPLACLRWEVAEITDPYGSSPGMDALGCSKALQLQTKRKAMAIDKLVDPPMVADGELQHKPSTLIPGGVTYAGFSQAGGSPKFQPAYVIKPEVSALVEDIQDVRQLIQQAMYTDLFLAITLADPRHATVPEIVERREEKLLMLGPVLQNHRGGLIKPIIDRTFYIAMRQGRLPPPPPELGGVDLKVEMTGMLAQALKAIQSSGIERFVGFVGSVAKAQADAGEAPTALDKIDMDQSIDEYSMALGVPPTVVRTDDAVAGIREQRAKAAAAQQQAAAAQPLAQGAKAVKDLSEAKVGGRSVLDAMADA